MITAARERRCQVLLPGGQHVNRKAPVSGDCVVRNTALVHADEEHWWLGRDGRHRTDCQAVTAKIPAGGNDADATYRAPHGIDKGIHRRPLVDSVIMTGRFALPIETNKYNFCTRRLYLDL